MNLRHLLPLSGCLRPPFADVREHVASETGEQDNPAASGLPN